MLKPDTYHCDRCRYDLAGLPDVGQCPECGNPYSIRAMLGVVVPEPGYAQGERWARRFRTLFLIVLALMMLSCGGLLSMIVPRGDRAWGVAGVLAGLLLLAALTSYVYEKDKG